jgi:hypothetical protein
MDAQAFLKLVFAGPNSAQILQYKIGQVQYFVG